MKSVKIRNFFWSVFSHIRTEYGEILVSKHENFRLKLYGNHTSAWVFSSKFAAHFQNTFSLGLLLKPGPGPWTWTVDPDPGPDPGRWTRTLGAGPWTMNPDPDLGKPGS